MNCKNHDEKKLFPDKTMNLGWFAFIMLISFSTILVFADSHDEADLLFKKAVDSHQLGNYNQAISYYDQVLEIDPNHLDALNNKGAVLLKLWRFEQAIPYFDKVLEIDPNNVSALINKGLYTLNTKCCFKALPYFAKALEIDPDYDIAKLELDRNTSLYSKIDGYVEIIVHDSQDRLVTYLVEQNLYVLDLDPVKDMIDAWPVTKVVNRNGQNFEVLIIVDQKTSNSDKVISGDRIKMNMTEFVTEDNDISSALAEQLITLRFMHPQYLLETGDTIYTVYSIFRPAE